MLFTNNLSIIYITAPFKGIQQTQNIHVKNDTESPIAFKVKTTAPKLYCVRPNSGVLQPGEAGQVTIIFQGLPDEPPLGSKCKDKFLFVSIPCLSDIASKDVSTNWAQLEQLAGGKSSDIKLKVAFNYDNPMNTIQEEKSNISGHSFSAANTSSNLNANSNGPAAAAAAAAAALATTNPINNNHINTNNSNFNNNNSSSHLNGHNIQPIEPIQTIPSSNIDRSIQSTGISSGIANNITNTNNSKPNPVVPASTDINEPINVSSTEKITSESKPSVHVAPPTTSSSATKISSNETNIYLIGLVLLVLAFLLSRLF